MVMLAGCAHGILECQVVYLLQTTVNLFYNYFVLAAVPIVYPEYRYKNGASMDWYTKSSHFAEPLKNKIRRIPQSQPKSAKNQI